MEQQQQRQHQQQRHKASHAPPTPLDGGDALFVVGVGVVDFSIAFAARPRPITGSASPFVRICR